MVKYLVPLLKAYNEKEEKEEFDNNGNNSNNNNNNNYSLSKTLDNLNREAANKREYQYNMLKKQQEQEQEQKEYGNNTNKNNNKTHSTNKWKNKYVDTNIDSVGIACKNASGISQYQNIDGFEKYVSNGYKFDFENKHYKHTHNELEEILNSKNAFASLIPDKEDESSSNTSGTRSRNNSNESTNKIGNGAHSNNNNVLVRYGNNSNDGNNGNVSDGDGHGDHAM